MSTDNTATVASQAQMREAARVSLRANLLDSKKKGDAITAAEIVEATGFENWYSFRRVIATWARANGLKVRAVANDGWRVLLDHEHLAEAERIRTSGLRKVVEEVRVLASVDSAKIDDRAQRRLQFQQVRVLARAQQARSHDVEIKRELKLGSDRVPLRIAKRAGGADENG